MKRIIEGHLRFQKEVFPRHSEMFAELRTRQQPEALLITCADSRIEPGWITQTSPGDLFICRNAGNIVPAWSSTPGGVSATIEYAVVALGVADIIVCGHSDCGAMRAVLHPEKLAGMSAVSGWLCHAGTALAVLRENYPDLEGEERLSILTQENVLAQLGNIQTHPSVAAKLRKGKLRLHGWVFDIPSGRLSAYDPAERRFVPLRMVPQVQEEVCA